MKYQIVAKDIQGDGGQQSKIKDLPDAASRQAYINKLKSAGWELVSMEPYKEPSVDYGNQQSRAISGIKPLDSVINAGKKMQDVEQDYQANTSFENPEVLAAREQANQLNTKQSDISPFWSGVKEGASLGLQDEVAGLVDEDTKDYIRAKNLVAKETNPISYGVGEWLGSIPTGLGVGKAVGIGARAAIPLVSRSATAATQLGKIATNPGVTSGVLEGAISGAGQADDGDRATGALAGAGSSLVGAWLGKSIGKKLGVSPVDNSKEFMSKVDDIVRAKKDIPLWVSNPKAKAGQEMSQLTPAQQADKEFREISPEMARYPAVGNMTSAKFNNALDEFLLRGGRDQYERLMHGAVAKETKDEAKEKAREYLAAKAAREAERQGIAIAPIQDNLVDQVMQADQLPAATAKSFNERAREALGKIPTPTSDGSYTGAGIVSSNLTSGDAFEQAAEQSAFGAQIADKLLSPKEERDRLERQAFDEAMALIMDYERRRGK